MASLEQAIHDVLAANVGVAAIVGDRIRPMNMAQDEEPPFITTSITREETLATLSDGAADYRPASFEIGVYAPTYKIVATLSEAIRALLDLYSETVSGVEFAPIMFDEESDIEQAVPEGQEKPVYVRVQTFKTLYRII